ncbi:MAG: transferase [Proteobacteria bacterium]|nr:transferase [Pseudomonadota bacterium]
MKSDVEKLIDRIIDRVSVNLRETGFDAGDWVRSIVSMDRFTKFYAFYGITLHHSLSFRFSRSALAGTYFLGKCDVDHSVLYKSDIRGDELKSQGDIFPFEGRDIPVHKDETIRIQDSFLIRTLVHNYSHDPENLEEFGIRNTIAMDYSNIHGSPVEGAFIAPFATIDLTTIHDCIIGPFSYVQAGELEHATVKSGMVWVRKHPDFDFSYRFDPEILKRYLEVEPGQPHQGIFWDFFRERQEDFQEVYQIWKSEPTLEEPEGASLSPYSVVKGECSLDKNVLVAQRAYLQDARLGVGANAQENCYIIGSTLAGYNITAHGAKVVHANLGKNGFVGFNSFIRGSKQAPLNVGEGVIFMPHTIVDAREPLEIPSNTIVWGYIAGSGDLKENSLPVEEFRKLRGFFSLGRLRFSGKGSAFVEAFEQRLNHILEANGAFATPGENKGHAQKNKNISFNTIQPYPAGEERGIYPTIIIKP